MGCRRTPPAGARPGEGTIIDTLHYRWEDYHWRRYEAEMLTPDFDGDPDYAPMWAGESCSVINDIKPAAEIVHDLAREAAAVLDRTPEAQPG